MRWTTRCAPAASVRVEGVAALVIDCETGPSRLGLAGELADAMGARHVAVEELDAARVGSAIRDSLN